ncbi:MAG: thiamine phosphate synthase [Wujia sp.]
MNLAHIVAVTNRRLAPVPTDKQIQELTSYLTYRPAKDILPLLVQIGLLADTDVEFIILREKDMETADYLLLSRAAIDICNKRHKKLVLHTYMDVAGKLEHPHIHLSYPALLNYASVQNGWPTGKPVTLGVSVHSREEAMQAEQLGATYLSAGHIFATDCKKGLPPRGLDWLKDITASVSIPTYAIGGITEDNLASVMWHGAAGGCMMSTAMRYTHQQPGICN